MFKKLNLNNGGASLASPPAPLFLFFCKLHVGYLYIHFIC